MVSRSWSTPACSSEPPPSPDTIPHVKHPLCALHTATALISAPASIALLCLTPSSHLWQDRIQAVSTARSSSWRLGISTFCELLHDVRHVGVSVARGLGLGRKRLQRVPRCARPMLPRAMFCHVEHPQMHMWLLRQFVCTMGVVWERMSVKIPVCRAYWCP